MDEWIPAFVGKTGTRALKRPNAKPMEMSGRLMKGYISPDSPAEVNSPDGSPVVRINSADRSI
jgi:hypothetical protein